VNSGDKAFVYGPKTLGQRRDQALGALSWILNALLLVKYPAEKAARRELKSAFERELKTESKSGHQLFDWTTNIDRLSVEVRTNDPRHFLRWKVVRETMFLSSVHGAELKFLKRAEWPFYRNAITEVPIGNPIRTPDMRTSANRIHQAYHIARFFDHRKNRIEDLKCIMEFGGGYGCMCHLLCSMGFKGEYVLYDLPHFSQLQKYYLTSTGLTVRSSADGARTSNPSIWCVSSFQELDVVLERIGLTDPSLFIATWSLSEAPVAVRNLVSKRIGGFSSFLIGYQNRFEQVDNSEYFRNFTKDFGSTAWRNVPIEHDKGNHYLFGEREPDAPPC